MYISHCLQSYLSVTKDTSTKIVSISRLVPLNMYVDVLTRIVDYSKEVLLCSSQQFYFVIQWVWSFIFLLPFQQKHTLRYIYLFWWETIHLVFLDLKIENHCKMLKLTCSKIFITTKGRISSLLFRQVVWGYKILTRALWTGSIFHPLSAITPSSGMSRAIWSPPNVIEVAMSYSCWYFLFTAWNIYTKIQCYFLTQTALRQF